MHSSKGEETMPRKDWTKIADDEFYDMDEESQKQWGELRRRLGL
jgi:hypothetical protein